MNPAYAALLGYDHPNTVLQTITSIAQQVYRNPGRWAELVTYLQQCESVVQFESPIQTANGENRWICESVRLVQEETGLLYIVEGTVRDITSRKEAERSRETDRLKLDYRSTID